MGNIMAYNGIQQNECSVQLSVGISHRKLVVEELENWIRENWKWEFRRELLKKN
jgi:hypothetical protein